MPLTRHDAETRLVDVTRLRTSVAHVDVACVAPLKHLNGELRRTDHRCATSAALSCIVVRSISERRKTSATILVVRILAIIMVEDTEEEEEEVHRVNVLVKFVQFAT